MEFENSKKAVTLGNNPNDPKTLSVPCVVLGLGHRDGQNATKAQLSSNYAQGWNNDATNANGYHSVDYPRNLASDPGVGSRTGLKEGGRAYLRIASPKNADRSVGEVAKGAAQQDGGNGSGGDAASGDYNADMIESRLGFTFWKRDTGGDQTPLASKSNESIAEIYAGNFDPGFARLFSSHSAAMDFLVVEGQFLHKLFQYVLVVAVNADRTDFSGFTKDGLC